MNNIGKRIKELRRKRDLTQEKLADFLGVTYQSVSKWETGVTFPDLGLIVPLARVLGVSTDELLGVNDYETDARRAEFEKWCDNYWKFDEEEAYLMAKQATEEYPGDYKFLQWLAGMEYYMAYHDKYREDPAVPYSMEMIDRSIKHSGMVIEGCTDHDIRERAIWNTVICYQYSGRREEALKYVEMFPEKKPITRDMALEICLEGEELMTHRQKMAKTALKDFCMTLHEMYCYAVDKNPHVMAALDTEEAVLRAVFSDGDLLDFNWYMYCIYEKRTELEVRAGDHDKAMEYLHEACRFAKQFDKICNGGVYSYSCKIMDLLKEDPSGNDFSKTDIQKGIPSKSFWELVTEELQIDGKYAPIRDREDFKALFE